MSDYNRGVQFDEPNFQNYITEETTPWIISFVMNVFGGVVKDEKQAQSFLLSVILIIFAVSFFIFFQGNKNEYSAGEFPVIPAEIRYINN